MRCRASPFSARRSGNCARPRPGRRSFVPGPAALAAMLVEGPPDPGSDRGHSLEPGPGERPCPVPFFRASLSKTDLRGDGTRILKAALLPRTEVSVTKLLTACRTGRVPFLSARGP